MPNKRKVTASGKKAINPESASVPNSDKREDGQYVDHWALNEEELSKGYVRPVRKAYKHLKCGCVTTMPEACARTYARMPDFYNSTFCCKCGYYFPTGKDGEFVWLDTDEKVGT